MRQTVITLLFSLFFTSVFSEGIDSTSFQGVSENELFSLGNESFKNDQYQEAIDYYSAIIEKDFESAEVYFNLGNAYFKLNDMPSAILYYEKARKMSPQDEDIKTNLDIANLKTIDKIETKPELPFTNWWSQLLNSNEIDDWAKKSIYLSFISLFLFLLYLFLKGVAKKVSFFAGLLIMLMSVSFYLLGEAQKARHLNGSYAIIFSSSVTVKGSPEDDGTRLFVIHEGAKVEILNTLDDWTEISLMNGNKGWIKSGVYRSI